MAWVGAVIAAVGALSQANDRKEAASNAARHTNEQYLLAMANQSGGAAGQAPTSDTQAAGVEEART